MLTVTLGLVRGATVIQHQIANTRKAGFLDQYAGSSTIVFSFNCKNAFYWVK